MSQQTPNPAETPENLMNSATTEATGAPVDTMRYVTDEDGNHYLSVQDIVESLLGIQERLDADPDVNNQVGVVLAQFAIQIATPFMEMSARADCP